MLQADIDKLLLRRLYLQRYATSIFNEVAKANRPLDRRLIFTLAEFIADADDKTLLALSRQSAGNPASRKLLSDISQILREQKDAARLILKESTDALIEREAIATTVAMGETKIPSMRGVATLPLAGVPQVSHLDDAHIRYTRRLISEISQTAPDGAVGMIKTVRGTSTGRLKTGYSSGVIKDY